MTKARIRQIAKWTLALTTALMGGGVATEVGSFAAFPWYAYAAVGFLMAGSGFLVTAPVMKD